MNEEYPNSAAPAREYATNLRTKEKAEDNDAEMRLRWRDALSSRPDLSTNGKSVQSDKIKEAARLALVTT